MMFGGRAKKRQNQQSFAPCREYQPNGGAQGVRPRRALRFTLDLATSQWREEPCIISVDLRPFAEGGMRLCFKAVEHRPDGKVLALAAFPDAPPAGTPVACKDLLWSEHEGIWDGAQ